MAKRAEKQKGTRRPADDIVHSLRSLASALDEGVSPRERFTARTVSIPEPGTYSPAALKKLRNELEMSQAVFAESLGVSRVWVQGWDAACATHRRWRDGYSTRSAKTPNRGLSRCGRKLRDVEAIERGAGIEHLQILKRTQGTHG